MTHIEQAIKEAGDWGWKTYCFVKGVKTNSMRQSEIFLDPLFWQALGKARGWGECAGDVPTVQPWALRWHRFINHLAEGKDAETFFKDL